MKDTLYFSYKKNFRNHSSSRKDRRSGVHTGLTEKGRVKLGTDIRVPWGHMEARKNSLVWTLPFHNTGVICTFSHWLFQDIRCFCSRIKAKWALEVHEDRLNDSRTPSTDHSGILPIIMFHLNWRKRVMVLCRFPDITTPCGKMGMQNWPCELYTGKLHESWPEH